MKSNPFIMEEYFDPGLKAKPAVIVGSQTLPLFHGLVKEQAWEGSALAASAKNDVAIVRNMDPYYLQYWRSLMDNPYIINLEMDSKDLGTYLTEAILANPQALDEIKRNMDPKSNLMVFIPTLLEQKLADELNISLHGSPRISDLYGTKSGIRRLAMEAGIPMAPGFICSTIVELDEAIAVLSRSFDTLVLKHDTSISGHFSKKLKTDGIFDIKTHADEIAGGKFINGQNIAVVEGWLKSEVSVCAHIEIPKGKKPIICGAWQQMLAADGVSYIGAGPLMLSKKAMDSFMTQVNKIASILYKNGAVGSFGPDFLIVDEGEKDLEPETCMLVELNARMPYTSFPLEIIKQVKGQIGDSFLARHINLPRVAMFSEIQDILQKEELLITKKDKNAKGVVPYNIGLLEWQLFDIVVMADTWEEVLLINRKVDEIFAQYFVNNSYYNFSHTAA